MKAGRGTRAKAWMVAVATTAVALLLAYEAVAQLVPNVPTVTTVWSRTWLRLQSAAEGRTALGVPHGITNSLMVALLACTTQEEAWAVLGVTGSPPPAATLTWDDGTVTFDDATVTWDIY